MYKAPDLTDVWNEAAEKCERGEMTIFEMNECWGCLRYLEKFNLCKISKL